MADRYVLLVEGRDDEHVFCHLLEHYQVPDRFEIINKKGIDNPLHTWLAWQEEPGAPMGLAITTCLSHLTKSTWRIKLLVLR